MDINHLISQYGYAALIVGSMAEGETITLLGSIWSAAASGDAFCAVSPARRREYVKRSA